MAAVGQGHVECVAYLLEQKADVTIVTTGDQFTKGMIALHLATNLESAEIAGKLVDAKPDTVNTADEDGNTPLHRRRTPATRPSSRAPRKGREPAGVRDGEGPRMAPPRRGGGVLRSGRRAERQEPEKRARACGGDGGSWPHLGSELLCFVGEARRCCVLKIVGGVGGGPDATLGTQLQELSRRQPRNDSFGSTSTRRRRRKQRGSGDVTPAEGAAAEKARLTDALREFEANFERQHRLTRPPLTEDEYAPVQALREQLRELKRNRSFERPSRRNGEDRASLGV